MRGKQWNRGAVIVIAMILNWASASGQNTDPTVSMFFMNDICGGIQAGTKVRLRVERGIEAGDPRTSAGDGILTGTLVACRDGFVVLRPAGAGADSVQVPMDQVFSLDVSQGRSNNALTGGIIGLLVGLVVSTASQTRNHQDEFMGGLQDMEDNINRGIGITVATTLVGIVIGSASGSEQWKSVYNGQIGDTYGGDLHGDYQVVVGFSF